MYQDFYLDNGNELTETKHGFEKRASGSSGCTIGWEKSAVGPFYVDRSKFASLRLSTPSSMPPVSYGTRSGDFSGISRVLLGCAIGWRQFAERTRAKLTARHSAS